MARRILLIVISILLLAASCTSRKNKLDRKDLIPEKDLVSILTEVHMADGLLALPVVNHWFASLDSLSAYIQVIENFGYSKETMDKTLKFYFIKNPKKLIKIYDQVLAILSEMETYLEQESSEEAARSKNMWRGREFYAFPNTSGPDSTDFEISLTSRGIYTLQITCTLMPDDQSYNPRMTAYSCNADSLETGKRDYYETNSFIKDGQKHMYFISPEVPSGQKLILRGKFFSYDNYLAEPDKHAMIDGITLLFGPIFE